MPAYFHLKPSGTQYMFNLKGGNHETVLTSERYRNKQGSQGGIASVKVNAPFDARDTTKKTHYGMNPTLF